MRRIFLALAFCLVASSASAATAYFTGNMEQVQTVTYRMAWNCEYRYGGQTFWRVFLNNCPYTIEVQ